MSSIRTRIPPSPTGLIHIGNLRTALYNYLYARQHGGQFIVRIEDTDQTRFVPGAMEKVLEMFAWAGLDWDEGPKLKLEVKSKKLENLNLTIEEVGKHGPYIQSERLPIYKKYAQELVDSGHAYHCFCTPERLAEMRAEQQAKKLPPKYDGKCRDLSKEEIIEKIRNLTSYVLRLKTPENKVIEFEDAVYGKISVNSDDVDDQVLMKSDGFPTYHLAVVVDDHLMAITHVMRGEDWLPSTPKHVLLYQVFGWPLPQYCHLPNILGENRKKLSKRTHAVSVEDFKNQGYLPQALLNYIALLGWNPGTEQELFSLEELIQAFDIKKIHKQGAIFDYKKLDHINGQYIRQLPSEELVGLCRPYLETAYSLAKYTDDYIASAVGVEQERLKKLSDIVQHAKLFFTDELAYEDELLHWKKTLQSHPDDAAMITAEILREVRRVWQNVSAEVWQTNSPEDHTFEYITRGELTNGEVLWPVRVALSGEKNSPGPFEIARVLGKDESLRRLDSAIAKLSTKTI